MTAAAIFQNKNSPYVTNGLTDLRDIWHSDAYWQVDSYLPYRQLKIRATSEQSKISICR